MTKRTSGARLVSPALIVLLASVVLGNGSGVMVLPILPRVVTDLASPAWAGAATAAMTVFMIALEIGAPRLLTRVSAPRAMTAAMVLQALAMLGIAAHPPLIVVLALGGCVGAGMGTFYTVSTIVLAWSVPKARFGEGMGYYAVAASAATLIAGPFGLLLWSNFGQTTVFLVSGGCALGAAALHAANRTRPSEVPEPPETGTRALASPRLALPLVSLLLRGLVSGSVTSFISFVLPAGGIGSAAAFLLVSGLLRMASRAAVGRVIDHSSGTVLVVSATVAGVLSLLLVTAGTPVLVLLAAALYGIGDGILVSSAVVAVRVRDGGHTALTTGLWNMCTDAGVGAGALASGAIGSAVGYPLLFVMLPVLVALAGGSRLAADRVPETLHPGGGPPTRQS